MFLALITWMGYEGILGPIGLVILLPLSTPLIFEMLIIYHITTPNYFREVERRLDPSGAIRPFGMHQSVLEGLISPGGVRWSSALQLYSTAVP